MAIIHALSQREQAKLDHYNAIRLFAEGFDVAITKMDWDNGILEFNGTTEAQNEFAMALSQHPVLRDICE